MQRLKINIIDRLNEEYVFIQTNRLCLMTMHKGLLIANSYINDLCVEFCSLVK